VAISGIHTHAGPGGYLQYVVYIVTSLGFVRQSFDVIVNGIEQSIVEAHSNLRPGKIYLNKGIYNYLCLTGLTRLFFQAHLALFWYCL
jgi:neutral ceramidase